MESQNLQQQQIDDTITASSADDGSAAGAGAPEDTANAYQATINQQGDTIDALLQANERLQQQMNNQIRALTKGDITKEAQVLRMDVHRALVELDAQALEYEELKKETNKP